MHEIAVPEDLDVVVDVHLRVVGRQPLLSVVRPLLVEEEVDTLVVLVVLVPELDLVLLHLREVFSRLLVVGGSETLVVLAVPSFEVSSLVRPGLEIGDREESHHLVLPSQVRALDDRGDELLEESDFFSLIGVEIEKQIKKLNKSFIIFNFYQSAYFLFF